MVIMCAILVVNQVILGGIYPQLYKILEALSPELLPQLCHPRVLLLLLGVVVTV